MSACRHVLCSATILAFAGAFTDPVGAEERPPLRLQIVDCPDAALSAQRLTEVLSVEIAPTALELSRERPLDGTAGVVRLCEKQRNTVGIELLRDGADIAQRQIELGDVGPETRPRIVAVILAEMLVAANSAALSTPKAAPSLSPTRPNARLYLISGGIRLPDRPKWTASAGLLARVYGRSAAPLWGSWVGATYRSLSSELLLGRAAAEKPIGELRLSYAALAAAFEPFELLRRPRLAPRLRFETGISWATGSPAKAIAVGGSGSAATGAGMLELGLELPLLRQTILEFRLAGGYSGGLTATTDAVPSLSTSGWMLSGGLGLGCAL